MVINERRKRGEAVTWLPIFKKHVMSAIERVLIVDTYLLCGGERSEDEILSWFPDTLMAHDVRIACGGLKAGRDERRFVTDLADRAAAINKRKSASGTRATTIKLKLTHDPSAFPFVHDRFAVVDDELWHFGATVGGLHHSVNAVTRGWSATAVKAVQIFGEVWGQPARRGGSRTALQFGGVMTNEANAAWPEERRDERLGYNPTQAYLGRKRVEVVDALADPPVGEEATQAVVVWLRQQRDTDKSLPDRSDLVEELISLSSKLVLLQMLQIC